MQLKKFDLHIHTTYSDGELSIEEVVEKAKEKGLDGIAITDHDNITSWDKIDKISEKLHYPIIKGVELSTYHKGRSVHILGYYLNNSKSYQNLNNLLIEICNQRKERLLKIIELLKQFDINLTYDEVIKLADGTVARPHIAAAIMNKYPSRNYTKDYIFSNFIGDDCPAFVPVNNLETEEAIKILKENNCLVVLAHPLYINNLNYKEVVDLGVDGVESFYNYSDTIKADVLDFTLANNLIATGGSDYHGPNIRNTIGTAYCYGNYLEKFLNRINFYNK